MEREKIQKTLADILERTVGEAPCAVEEAMNLKDDLRLDSIDVVTMAIEIQSEFRIDLKTPELMRLVTVKDLIDLIQIKIAPEQSQAA
jgi:acyl carrier protein